MEVHPIFSWLCHLLPLCCGWDGTSPGHHGSPGLPAGIHGQTEMKTFCSLNASNACQKYLCGRWKVNFSFSFFNGRGVGRV